jgi:hypothetical protein
VDTIVLEEHTATVFKVVVTMVTVVTLVNGQT